MATVTRLVLVRHAVTAHSEQGRWSGRSEEPLTERGRWMAERIAERLASAKEITAIYASPLRRAQETAAPLARALGLAVETDPDLQEADFGEWEGVPFAQVLGGDTQRFAAYVSGGARAGGTGETVAEMAERAVRFLERVVREHPGETVAAVAHGGPMRSMLCHAIGASFEVVIRLQQDHGSISVLDHTGLWLVRLLNDTTHLHEGAGLPAVGRLSGYIAQGYQVERGDEQEVTAPGGDPVEHAGERR